MPLPKLPKFRELEIGFGPIKGKWSVDETQEKAAWALYVEYVTRVSVHGRAVSAGSPRGQLTSLYSLFESTRGVLREYGPGIARPVGDPDEPGRRLSLGEVALIMLNYVLRPFLDHWHPLVSAYETGGAPVGAGGAFPQASQFEHELLQCRQRLRPYIDLLAEAANVADLTVPPQSSS